MLHCRHGVVFGWVTVVALLTGCATPRKESAKVVEPPPVAEVDKDVVEAHAHYLQGLIYDLGEQPQQAQEEFSKAALADPANQDLVMELSQGYLEQKHPEKAYELLLRATKQTNAPGELFAQLALVCSKLGKDEQAVEAAQTAIKRAPDSIAGYRTLFFILLEKGRPKEALKVLDRAVKVADTAAEFNVELVELYAALEHQAPSEKNAIAPNATIALAHASSQNITDPHVRLRLADDYSLMGDTTNAVKIYAPLVEEFSEVPAIRAKIHEKLGAIYLEQKNYDKATEQFQAVAQDDPENPNNYFQLGLLAEQAGKLPEAEDYFQKTLLLSDSERVYYALAEIQINLNQPKEALDTLKRAQGKFRAGFQSEYITALALQKEKDYTNAISRFTSAEVLAKASDQPSILDGDFYFEQGATYERLGNYEQAERCFEKSIVLSPDFAEALNYLGYMLADRGEKLEKAHDLIEKAVKIDPKNPAYLDSLGWVLYKLKRSQEALVQEQKAIDLTEEPDPTLFDHIGDIYAALKQTDKAREAWTKSLKLEANEEVRKKLDGDTIKAGH